MHYGRLYMSSSSAAAQRLAATVAHARAAGSWEGSWEEWAAQEPINAHSHLLAMLTGNSESIGVVDGVLQLGTWQSLLLVDLDGPRQRSVGLQFTGLTAAASA